MVLQASNRRGTKYDGEQMYCTVTITTQYNSSYWITQGIQSIFINISTHPTVHYKILKTTKDVYI